MEYFIQMVSLGCLRAVWTNGLSLLGFQKNHFPSKQIHYLSTSSTFSQPHLILFFQMLQANPLLKLNNENKTILETHIPNHRPTEESLVAKGQGSLQ